MLVDVCLPLCQGSNGSAREQQSVSQSTEEGGRDDGSIIVATDLPDVRVFCVRVMKGCVCGCVCGDTQRVRLLRFMYSLKIQVADGTQPV